MINLGKKIPILVTTVSCQALDTCITSQTLTTSIGKSMENLYKYNYTYSKEEFYKQQFLLSLQLLSKWNATSACEKGFGDALMLLLSEKQSRNVSLPHITSEHFIMSITTNCL